MGNYSSELKKQQDELLQFTIERRRKLDQDFPAIERPCGTPAAIYSIVVEGTRLEISVELPFDIEDAIPADAKDTMKQSLHDAVLPVIEQFYKDVWAGTLAGKTIDDTGPLPAKWGLLFEKWIRRCWQRDSFDKRLPSRNGSWVARNWYQLPEDYQWEHPSRGDTDGYQ